MDSGGGRRNPVKFILKFTLLHPSIGVGPLVGYNKQFKYVSLDSEKF